MATIQYTVIPALFLAQHTYVTVTQAISVRPEKKGHLLMKSPACFLNSAVGAFWRGCTW